MTVEATSEEIGQADNSVEIAGPAIKFINCSAEEVGLAFGSLPDRIRLAAVFTGRGVEVPEDHEAAIASAIAEVTEELEVRKLSANKASLIRQINIEAENQRLKYITPGAGQALTYQEKLTQARACLAETSPAPADYPMLANEVGITGADIRDVAQVIVDAYASWQTIGAAIEKTRMAANKAIAEAVDEEVANAAFAAIVWP